jgi:hypothetical protein
MESGISIVMAYYNRKEQLNRTLQSIKKSLFDKKKLEIIIVNDCSLDEHNIDDFIKKYKSLNIKIINIKKEEKIWFNSSIPYNIGLNNVKYDKILIQNPESYHVGDILTDLNERLTKYSYINYACYSISKKEYNENNYDKINYLNEKNKFICESGWYNHFNINPTCYHYASAIFTENIFKLNGFDEIYKDGIGWDDNELLFRIKRLGLNIKLTNKPFVLHQWHESNFHYNDLSPKEEIEEKNNLFYKNRDLFINHTIKKNIYKAENNIYYNKTNFK